MIYKGLVLEIKEDYALVMRDNGTIIKVGLKDGLAEGDSIFYLADDILCSGNTESKKTNKITRIITPLITLAALIMICITPLVLNAFTPKSYGVVTIDINPSISIEIDKQYRIIRTKGLNEEGKVLNIEDIKGKSLEYGISLIKSKVLASKTITNKDSVIIGFAFLGDEEDKAFEDKLKSSLIKEFKGFEVIYIKGDKSTLKKAEKKGASLGRYKALETVKGNVTEEELEKLTVDELIKLLREYSKKPGANKDTIEDIRDELEDREEETISNNKVNKPSKNSINTHKPNKGNTDDNDTDDVEDKNDSKDDDTDSSDNTGSDDTDSNDDSSLDDSDSD